MTNKILILYWFFFKIKIRRIIFRRITVPSFIVFRKSSIPGLNQVYPKLHPKSLQPILEILKYQFLRESDDRNLKIFRLILGCGRSKLNCFWGNCRKGFQETGWWMVHSKLQEIRKRSTYASEANLVNLPKMNRIWHHFV